MKAKQAVAAPARDLYTSQLFRGLREYAEATADRWYILSAEHGLVAPDQVLESYEQTLNTMAKQDRLAWTERVCDQLLKVLPTNAEVVLLAGLRYREGIVPFLKERGFNVQIPLEGLPIGKQLRRLKQLRVRGFDEG